MQVDPLMAEFACAVADGALGFSAKCRALANDDIHSLGGLVRHWRWLIATHQNYVEASTERRKQLDDFMPRGVVGGGLIDLIDFEHHDLCKCNFPLEYFGDLRAALDVLNDQFERMIERADSGMNDHGGTQVDYIRSQISLARKTLAVWADAVEALDEDRWALQDWQNKILLRDAARAYGGYEMRVEDFAVLQNIEIERLRHLVDLSARAVQADTPGQMMAEHLTQIDFHLRLLSVSATSRAEGLLHEIAMAIKPRPT